MRFEIELILINRQDHAYLHCLTRMLLQRRTMTKPLRFTKISIHYFNNAAFVTHNTKTVCIMKSVMTIIINLIKIAYIDSIIC